MDNGLITNEQPEWLNLIVDTELRRAVSEGLRTGDLSGLIRTAFILLERRIRESAGLAEHEYGTDLINKAFNPESGLLQPVSPVPAERAGLHKLLLGVFLYYRNPVAHRPVYYTEQSAQQVLFLIDHALQLVDQAAELVFDLSDFVGNHEGRVVRRRDYRLDIDGDGEQELVLLLELGPTSVAGSMTPHLMPVILKKEERGYRRIPAEGVVGGSTYGPLGVQIRHVTSPDRPDIVVSWTAGWSSVLMLILVYRDEKFVVARREIAPGTTEPYTGPIEKGFLLHHYRQNLNFADVDGDGITELIQSLVFDPEELAGLGYGNPASTGNERYEVCRLLKWNAEQERIVQLEERLVVREAT